MLVKKRLVTTDRVWYDSSVVKGLSTDNPEQAEAMAWADARPIAYKIVNSSSAFGKNAGFYLGYMRGEGSANLLSRLRSFMLETQRDDPFWGPRARFALEHFSDRGFKTGFFQQWDGRYYRGGCTLDYTDLRRDEVIDRFLAWCDVGYVFKTVNIQINQKIVRVLDKDVEPK